MSTPPESLGALAAAPRPTSVALVIERMSAIEDALAPQHGVAVFTRLYRWTTEQVDAAIDVGRFERLDEMAALDVEFADLYFDAVDAWATGEPIPAAWRPLFDRADDPDIPATAFALAGMHAHINRDLAVALVRTAEEPLVDDSDRFRDYEAINEVLAQTSDQIRDRILPPALVGVDAAMGEVDDAMVMRAISTARRAAWEVAQRLQAVSFFPPALEAAVAVLDTSVGATSRAILDPGGVIGA